MILPGIYIGVTERKERGVFSNAEILADTVIEVSPVIVMSFKERMLLDQTLLHDYIFEWEANDTEQCCMALGYIPVYNHSYSSNCEYFMNYDNDTIHIKAVRNIAANEELTINYNGDWNDERPVWFDVAQ